MQSVPGGRLQQPEESRHRQEKEREERKEKKERKDEEQEGKQEKDAPKQEKGDATASFQDLYQALQDSADPIFRALRSVCFVIGAILTVRGFTRLESMKKWTHRELRREFPDAFADHEPPVESEASTASPTQTRPSRRIRRAGLPEIRGRLVGLALDEAREDGQDVVLHVYHTPWLRWHLGLTHRKVTAYRDTVAIDLAGITLHPSEETRDYIDRSLVGKKVGVEFLLNPSLLEDSKETSKPRKGGSVREPLSSSDGRGGRSPTEDFSTSGSESLRDPEIRPFPAQIWYRPGFLRSKRDLSVDLVERGLAYTPPEHHGRASHHFPAPPWKLYQWRLLPSKSIKTLSKAQKTAQQNGAGCWKLVAPKKPVSGFRAQDWLKNGKLISRKLPQKLPSKDSVARTLRKFLRK